MAKRSKSESLPPREITRMRIRRTLQFSVWTLGLAGLVLGAGWLLMRGERFLVEDSRFLIAQHEPGVEDTAVVVTGERHASASSIRGVFGEDRGRSLYRLDLQERRQALQRVEWVHDATVRRVWPNRVAVEVTERVPVAFLQIPVRATGKSGAPVAYRPLLIDAEGVLLTPRSDLPWDLPLVTGIRETDHPEVRRDRITRARRLLDALGEARENLDEIDVSDAENLKISYRLHEREYILVLGNDRFQERFDRFTRGFPEWKSSLPPRAIIDLTHDSRVITTPLPAAGE